ncbi:MAG TPA: exonuclease domain-containing protein [Candidatus Paceibacterota bacterium]|nr:exonuclease domain-containing protein [Candidatus Paceibacterota bacterium]
MKKIIFLDTETTGNEPKKDFLCQLAYKTDGETFSELYKPAIPIPPEASAVTHITNKMVADKKVFKESDEYQKIKELLESPDSIMVAHNNKFDYEIIKKEGITPARTICTLRVARALDKNNVIPQYRLQYLRYFLDIDIEACAHDALGDVLVLEKLFERLLDKIIKEDQVTEEEAIEKMIEISSRPSLMNAFNFGKYMGKTIAEVAEIDRGYLEWMLAQKEQNNSEAEEDWIYTLKYYLSK